jgi:UDP-glucuronate 4-epimerase
LPSVFANHRFDRVIHLAARAGVRQSIAEPLQFVHANLVGFAHLLEACRLAGVDQLTYASTSSVYGANSSLPFSEADGTDHPLQLYAATKRANELMAHAYSHLFALPTTGLRFFTVYGPWGRPDMALFTFTRAILAGEPVDLFNQGQHSRDFTYIDDLVGGIVAASDRIAGPDPAWSGGHPDPGSGAGPFRIYNLGGGKPVALDQLVQALEAELGVKANRRFLPLQPGDVADTAADLDRARRDLGYHPQTGVRAGVAHFVAWYREFYGV